MLIYKIASNSHDWEQHVSDVNLEFRNIVPSRFSFLTSMRIATECKKEKPDAIIVFRHIDAVAALSARKLSTDKSGCAPYPIFLYALYDGLVPRNISGEVADQIDGIIFDCPETRSRWEKLQNFDKIKKEYLLYPPGGDAVQEDIQTLREAGFDDHGTPINNQPLVIGYVGPIGEGTTLKKLLDEVIGMPENERPKIIVLGTARASVVMPLVKKARANCLNVDWKGDEYEKTEITSQIQAFIASSPALSTFEKQLMANGVPMLTTLSQPITSDHLKELSRQSRKTYSEKYATGIFSAQLIDIIQKN